VRLIALVFLVSSCFPLSHVVREDGGGRLVEYVVNYKRFQLENRRVKIKGICASACTLYLGLDNVCVTRGAKIGFHGAQSRGEWSKAGTKFLADYYKPKLREWFWKEAAYLYRNNEVIWLSGEEISKLNDTEIC